MRDVPLKVVYVCIQRLQRRCCDDSFDENSERTVLQSVIAVVVVAVMVMEMKMKQYNQCT